MSYLHCPTCQRAYNLALSTQCPSCPVPATEVDATEDIVAAAEQLARAMARASPAERKAATTRMDQLALPAAGAKPVTFHGAMLRSIRDALEPVAPPPVPKPQPLLAALAFAVVERISDRITELGARAPQLAERIPSRLRRATSRVRDRVRALAA
jgi:hypothetical protein